MLRKIKVKTESLEFDGLYAAEFINQFANV